MYSKCKSTTHVNYIFTMSIVDNVFLEMSESLPVPYSRSLALTSQVGVLTLCMATHPYDHSPMQNTIIAKCSLSMYCCGTCIYYCLLLIPMSD